MKEATEERHIRQLGVVVGMYRLIAEEKAPHRARVAGRKRHAMSGRDVAQAVHQHPSLRRDAIVHCREKYIDRVS